VTIWSNNRLSLQVGIVLGGVALAVSVGAGTASADTNGWGVMTVPAPAAGNDTLNAVAASGGSDAWAVGTQFTVPDANFVSAHTLAVHWNGSGWVRTTTPSAASNQTLAAVAASPSDAWAVGNTKPSGYSVGIPLALHWNGTAWSAVATAPGIPTGPLTAVADLGPTNAWAVGTAGKYNQLVEHWDGTAWSAVIVPNPINPPATVTRLTAISARNANDIWAVGRFCCSDTGEGLYALHYDGTAWTSSLIGAQSYAPPLIASSVVGVGPNEAWLVATASVAGGQAAIFHWNGTAWSASAMPALGDYPTLNGVAARAPNDVWAVGNLLTDVNTPNPKRRTQSVHWDGTRWSVLSTGTMDAALTGVAATASTGRLWAVGTGSAALVLTRTG
jgi:hypothetical protein